MVEAKYSEPAAVDAALHRCLQAVHEPRPALGGLGSGVYRLEYCTTRPTVFAWFFSSEQDDCAFLSGDLPDLLGLPLSPEAASDFTVAAINELVTRRPADLQSEDQMLTYLTGVLSLATPFGVKIVLRSPEDIWKGRPSIPKRGDRKLSKPAEEEIRAPSVRRSFSGITAWTLYTWEDPGGLVRRNEVLLWPTGRLSLRSRVIASRVGPYSHDVRIVF